MSEWIFVEAEEFEVSARLSWKPIGATALSAGLYATAFPPLAWAPLAWLALVPFLWAVSQTSAVGGFALGCLWSLTVGLATAGWLPSMIAEYFAAGPAEAWLAATAATLATGVGYGAFGAFAATLARRGRLGVASVAVGWAACEFARTQGALANPWALSGYSQLPLLPVVQIADVVGVVGVGALLAAANAALAITLLPRLRGDWWRTEIFAVGAITAMCVLYGAFRLGEPLAAAPQTVDVALVQSAIEPARRWQPRYSRSNLARTTALATRAAAAAPDAILLPELAIDQPLAADAPQLRRLGELAATTGADLLVGLPAQWAAGHSRATTNTFAVLRNGAVVDRYDKVALTPFSETNPLRGVARLGFDEYVPGDSRRPVSSKAGLVGVLLCSEAMVGAHAREAVLRGATLLANPANDSWFASAAASQMQLDIAAMRAIETRRPLLRPTLTGYTAAIDAQGRVDAVDELGVPVVLHARVHPSTTTTAYVRWGDAFGQLSLLAAAVLLASSWRRQLFQEKK